MGDKGGMEFIQCIDVNLGGVVCVLIVCLLTLKGSPQRPY